MPDVQVLTTTVSPRNRAISLLLDNGATVRFALLRKSNGEVHWSGDTFTSATPDAPLQWSGHIGRVSVADVIARVPACATDVVRWTRDEIDDGANLIEFDIFARDVRRRALDRLAAELSLVARAA